MKKILLLFVTIFLLISCSDNKPEVKVEVEPKYRNGDYVYFTVPGEKDVDTLFGMVDMFLFDEPILIDENTKKYRIKYKLDNGKYTHDFIDENLIIRKK